MLPDKNKDRKCRHRDGANREARRIVLITTRLSQRARRGGEMGGEGGGLRNRFNVFESTARSFEMISKISFEWPFLRQRALVVMDMRERGVGARGSRRFWLAAFGRKRDVIRAAALCHTAALIDAHVETPELHLFFKWERVAIGSKIWAAAAARDGRGRM